MYTVDLKIFVVKNVFVVCVNHENKNEIYFTMDNHAVSRFLYTRHSFTAQLFSYFILDFFDTTVADLGFHEGGF